MSLTLFSLLTIFLIFVCAPSGLLLEDPECSFFRPWEEAGDCDDEPGLLEPGLELPGLELSGLLEPGLDPEPGLLPLPPDGELEDCGF